MTSGTFVTSILTNDLIYDNILRSVDPCTLVRIARTCHTAHAAVQSHVHRSFNINTHFSRYFLDPLAFRALQATTGTLVSGSNALQFLDRSFWPDSDLDLYCFYDARADVGEWLQEQGYTFEPNSRQKASFHLAVKHPKLPDFDYIRDDELYQRTKNISAVYTFGKLVDTSQGKATKLKVQVVVACSSPMEVIFGFHSTLVLNVISFSHAYSLYPRATFHHRVALELLDYFDFSAKGVKAKYTPRGWRFTDTAPIPHDPALTLCKARALPGLDQEECLRQHREEKSLAFAFLDGLRWIGDSHSWVLPLPTKDLQALLNLADTPTSLPHDPSIATTWKMQGWPKERRGNKIEKRIWTRVRHAGFGFRYSYVIADDTLWKTQTMFRQRHQKQAVGGPPIANDYFDQQFLDLCKSNLEDKGQWTVWYPRDKGAA